MKKQLFAKAFGLFCLFLIHACASETETDISLVPSINSSEINDIVSYLSSDDLQGRLTGSPEIDVAANYIEKQFKTYGLSPYFDTYRDEFFAEDTQAFNVLAVLEGTNESLKNEYILISAHYDHIGITESKENDSIANGANDNAAGTAAVLALANYYSQTKSNKRSLIFALFSAEELGLLGSKHLAKKLKKQNLNLYSAINFEMIGIPLKDKDYTAYITGYEASNMASKFNEYTQSTLIGFLPEAKEYNLFKRSDNYPFYQEFNIPAQTISTFDFTNYAYYHHPDDEFENLDYEHMASLLMQLVPAIEGMANSTSQEIRLN